MEKVEDDFMEKAPTDPKDVVRFVKEVPYWTAKKHGKKYRLMYQVYTHPKYIEHGKKFFEGVNERYTEYAKRLEPNIGIPYTVITPLIFIFVRACVHYAMFEDEYYLKTQMDVLKQGVALFVDKYQASQAYLRLLWQSDFQPRRCKQRPRLRFLRKDDLQPRGLRQRSYLRLLRKDDLQPRGLRQRSYLRFLRKDNL